MSKALWLGALVSLVSTAAFAGEDKHYWEKRDVNPTANDEEQKRDKHYWENRDVEGTVSTVEQPGHLALAPEPAHEEEAPQKGQAPQSDAKQATEHAVPAPAPAAPPADTERKRFMSFEAGGGVGGFVDQRMWSQTYTAGQWTARAVVGTRSHFGGELAYVGSAQGVSTLGVEPGATLVGNGGETAMRFNLLTGMWQPYATAGVGFMHYSLGNAQLTTSDVSQSGNVATFPFGVGLAWRTHGLVLDGRFSMHPATSSEMLREANLSTWDVNAKAGFEF